MSKLISQVEGPEHISSPIAVLHIPHSSPHSEPQRHLNRSRILSRPACAQPSSSFAPGAPAAPMEPMTSSPSLITTPPPKNMTCGSFASGAIESSPFARSAKASVSFLKDTLVYALSCALSSVWMPAPSPRSAAPRWRRRRHRARPRFRGNPAWRRPRSSRSPLQPRAPRECDASAVYPPTTSTHR